MAKPLLDDALWQIIEPLLPPLKPRRFRYPGRKPLTHRQALTGILFVLKSGIAWNLLPREMNCGSGSACRKRLAQWQRLGVWKRLHHVLLKHLREAEKIDWERAVVDSASVRAIEGGEETGKNPTDRAKKGSKHHVLTDAQGTPLSTQLTGANRHGSTQLLPLVDAVPAVSGKPGQPRKRPKALLGDRAYDAKKYRFALRRRGIRPKLARRGTPHGSGLGNTVSSEPRCMQRRPSPGSLRARHPLPPAGEGTGASARRKRHRHDAPAIPTIGIRRGGSLSAPSPGTTSSPSCACAASAVR